MNPTTTEYRIRLKGHLDHHWASWFNDLTLTHVEDGTTVLSGPISDQAALFGLLLKIRDLGVPLLSINRVDESFS